MIVKLSKGSQKYFLNFNQISVLSFLVKYIYKKVSYLLFLKLFALLINQTYCNSK